MFPYVGKVAHARSVVMSQLCSRFLKTSLKNWELLRNVTNKLCVIGHLFMPGISKSRVSPDC